MSRIRPADIKTVEDANGALQRLAKWRMHFAGWLLGTRAETDPQAQWVRDNTEKVLILRAEVSALTRLLIDNKIITPEQLTIQVGVEAQALSNMMEDRWPGVVATDMGLSYDLEKLREADWMNGWLP